MYDAADGADEFAMMTEWRQFRMPSRNFIQKVIAGNVVCDELISMTDRNSKNKVSYIPESEKSKIKESYRHILIKKAVSITLADI